MTADEATRRGWRISGALSDIFGHVFIHTDTHTHTRMHAHTHTQSTFMLDIFPLLLRSSPPSSVPCALWGLWSQAPQLQAVVRDWRLESSDVHFPGSLSACTYLVIVIGTAAAVLWDRSCLFPQGGFIIILFIYSLLHCLFASTKSKFQEGMDHTDVFTPVSPGWLRVGTQ